MDNITPTLFQQLGITFDTDIITYDEDDIIYKYFECNLKGIYNWSYTKYMNDESNLNILHYERHV